MEESGEETLKREETLRIYHSTKEAVKIIDDVARDAIQDLPSRQLSVEQNDYR